MGGIVRPPLETIYQFLYTFSEIASGNYTQTHLPIVQENLENTF